MRKRYAELPVSLEAWICPPAPAGQGQTVAELQRARISHFLLPILLINFWGIISSFFLHGSSGGFGYITLRVASQLALIAVCLTLCHWRRAQLAAWIYCVWIAVTIFFVISLPGQPQNVPTIMIPLLLLMPVYSSGVLLGAGASWGFVLVIGVLSLGAPAQAMDVTDKLGLAQSLLVGTGIISLGMHGFHRALRAADRSEELAALNQQLAADITERYAMEERLRVTLEESERVRRELAAVIDNVQDALAVIDMDLVPMHINPAAKMLFGFGDTYQSRRLTLLTQDYFHVTQLDGSPMQPEEYQVVCVLRGGVACDPRYARIVRADGTARIVLTSAVPLNDASGRQFGALNISRDVTTEYYSARNMRVMQAVTRACASTAEEVAVADAALIELLKGLDVPTGAIVVPDSKRPGYARLIAGQMGDGVIAAEQSAMLAAFENTPVATAQPPLRFLRGLATGEAITDTIPHQWKTVAPTLAEGQAITISGLPLTFDGAVLGLLVLCYHRQRAATWEESDSTLAQAAAGEIAISLHRAQLYEEARRLALFDPLTGLHNHRAIQDILQRELTLGAAQSLPVSLIMLDIDHFRHLNETCGHDMGDRALRGVAQIIQKILGEAGYAARYGGEEFAIILPGVDAIRAHVVATDLLEAIAQHPIPAEGTLSLTASLGHATFPIHASAPPSLLKAADLALFAAKRAGRNRVVAYTPTLLEENARTFPTLITARVENLSEITLPSGAGLEAVQALITAVDLRDGYTAAHSAGVSRYSVAIAGEMGLPAEHIEALRMGGLVHDVGKIGTPDHILRKPGKLTDEEWVLMRAHTIMGEEILRHVEQLSHLLPLVRWHHERLDGSGYPDGLKGDEIPLLVRILSVADVFEAYTAERPYHPGRPASDGLKLLQHEVTLNRMDSRVVNALEVILVSQGLVHMTLRSQNDLQEAA